MRTIGVGAALMVLGSAGAHAQQSVAVSATVVPALDTSATTVSVTADDGGLVVRASPDAPPRRGTLEYLYVEPDRLRDAAVRSDARYGDEAMPVRQIELVLDPTRAVGIVVTRVIASNS